ncbi:MAG: HPr kinase/phosphatase C-terminal domain-containing protein [Rhodospirillaceae bacterium]|nr:HPr kinase/phosphatase C-terminal domain-containing protein [Rhodospirillaceae bacterium]
MSEPARIRIDGVAVAIGEVAVLLRGPSGSGRSDLALRLIDEGARLISDEQVELERRDRRLFATVPQGMPGDLVGRIEARGIGIVPVPHVPTPLPLSWVIDLRPRQEIERLPAARDVDYLGISVPALVLDPFAASATSKLRLAVKCGPDLIMGRT